MLLEPRSVKLTTRTEIEVRRNLPHAHRRRIGAWVFLDHFGPTPQVEGMTVAAHPHTGLQTVTWLFDGAVDHRDSLGTAQTITPGALNLMTAGRAVAHSEKSLPGPTSLHAVQLWLALPDSVRHMQPTFEHVDEIPIVEFGATSAHVFIGRLGDAHSPATVFSPLVGAELQIAGDSVIPLVESWEHGVLAVDGDITVNGEAVPKDSLYVLDTGHHQLSVGGHGRAILIGGAPFTEQIVMWWNFIGRSTDEIVAMREAWNLQTYPQFADHVGGWIPAPEMPNVTLQPR
jgi:redox-sensitive bicupin YhaK (pirin superfamily)